MTQKYTDQRDESLFRSIVSYEDITTADGAGDGSTLLCSRLTTKPDFDGGMVVIASGPYKGQSRDINGVTTDGTVTPNLDFDGKITANTKFKIITVRTTPAEVAAIEAKLDNETYGLEALKTLLDAILLDTGTTLETKLDNLKTVTDAILVDTSTTLENKLDAIDALIDAVETKCDAIKTETDKIPHAALCITQWGGFEDEILLKAAADPAALDAATKFTPTLPTGATVWKAYLIMKFREIYCAGANYVKTAGSVQVQKSAGGSWVTGVTIATGTFDVAAGASAAGDCLLGNADVSAQVASDSEVQFQLVTLRSNADDLAIRDVQFGLQIYFTL